VYPLFYIITGISNFTFLILELFPYVVITENNKKLLDLEDFYLKSLLPNYNNLTEAGSSFGYKQSEITTINMKANYSEERRMTIGNLNRDKSFSPDTIENMRQAALSRRKTMISTEALLNMKKTLKLYLYIILTTQYTKNFLV